jgi:hypothetical protein
MPTPKNNNKNTAMKTKPHYRQYAFNLTLPSLNVGNPQKLKIGAEDK